MRMNGNNTAGKSIKPKKLDDGTRNSGTVTEIWPCGLY